MDLQTEHNLFSSNIYNIIPMYGVSFVPTKVSAWGLKLPSSQESRCLGTCVFNTSILHKMHVLRDVFHAVGYMLSDWMSWNLSTWVNQQRILNTWLAKDVKTQWFLVSFQRDLKKLEDSICLVSFSSDYVEKYHVPLAKSLIEYSNWKDLRLKRAIISEPESLRFIPPSKVCIYGSFAAA